EFVEVRARAADGLARWQRHGHLGFGAPRIHEALDEPQTGIARGDAGEVAGGRVASIALAGSVEVLLALIDIAGGEILRVDSLPLPALRFRDVLPGVDKGG